MTREYLPLTPPTLSGIWTNGEVSAGGVRFPVRQAWRGGEPRAARTAIRCLEQDERDGRPVRRGRYQPLRLASVAPSALPWVIFKKGRMA